jgi:hypothetical protein
LGEETELGDILAGNTDGISGTQEWADWSLQITVPDTGIPQNNYYELRIQSRDMSEGEVVIQRIAASVGTTVKRTHLYATIGTHRATLSIETPVGWQFVTLGRERKALDIAFDVPTGTTASAEYRAGERQDDGSTSWDATWQSDPTLASHKDDLQVESALTGDGTKTPVLLARTPSVDYRLLIGRKDLGTFLKWDASELPGGAIFESFDEWEDLSEIVIQDKRGGDFDRTALYDPVKILREFTVLVFTPEARRYLAKNWGLELFVIEDEDTALTVKLKGCQIAKRPFSKTINEQTYSVYEARIPTGSVVTEVNELP